MNEPTTEKQLPVRTVDVPDPAYQPTTAELQEDLRLPGSFEDAIKAILRPVRVRKVMPGKKTSMGEDS